MSKKYRAFISYSHTDIKFARWLQRKIENYKIPKKLRVKYPYLPKSLKRSLFRDEEELPISSLLPESLTHALEESEFLIVIASPYSCSSKWVNREIEYFKNYHNNGQVLAIIKEGEPYAKEGQLEAFPPALLSNGEEPIAGDGRSFWNRKRALMKLIAGLLKVDFSDLWEREKQESKKRAIRLFSFLAIFISIAVYASFQFHGNIIHDELIQIDKKISEIKYELRHTTLIEKRAIALNKELHKLKKDKENKEESLVFLGRLEGNIGKKVNQVYHEKGAKEAIKILNSRENKAKRELQREAFSLELITLAKLYIEEYQFENAKKSYSKAIEIFFSFENVSEYAIFLWKQREPQKAIKLYEELVKKEKLTRPKEIELLRYLARAYDDNNQLKKSEETYTKVLKLYRKKTNNFQKGLALTLDNLGKLYFKTNRIEEAIDSYQKALDVLERLENRNYQEDTIELFSIKNNLALAYKEINLFGKAEKYSVEALQLVEKISKKYPDKYRGELARLLLNLSFIYQTNKKFDDSKGAFLKSLTLTRLLAKENPSVYKEELVKTLFVSSSRYFVSQKKEQSDKALSKALELSETLFKKNPNLYSILFSHALYLKAIRSSLEKNPNEALLFYDKALEVIKVIKEANPDGYQEKSGEIYLSRASLYFPLLFRPKEAEESILKALECYTLLTRRHPRKFNRLLGDTFIELGGFYTLQNKMEKAENNYLKSVEIYRMLAVENPKQYNGEFATKLNELANFYKKIKALKKSERTYIEALELERKIVKKYPQFLSRVQLSQTLWSFSLLYLEHLQDIGKSEKLMLESLEIEKQLTEESDSFIYLKNFLNHLNALGTIYSFTNQLQKAENILLKSLKINRELVKLDSTLYQKNLADNFHRLASLYIQLKQTNKAKEYYLEALRIFREIEKPSVVSASIGIESSKAEIGTQLAKLEKRENYIEKAESYYLDSLKIRREIVKIVTKNELAFGRYFLKLQKVALSHLLADLSKLYLDKEKKEKAKEYYIEGLNLQYSLLEKGVVDYHISYTLTVIRGVERFGLSRNRLIEANERLQKFKEEISINKMITVVDNILESH